MAIKGRFLIDDFDLFQTYSCIVRSVDGLDVMPKVKAREQHNWPDESGVEVDTATSIKYEALDISMNLTVVEATFKDAVKKINELIILLSGDGYHLLTSVLRGKVYPVLLQEISGYKQLTSAIANRIGLEFSIKLLGPLPELRMGSAIITVDIPSIVTINSNTDKKVTMWWGDGTSSTGTGELTHTYTTIGTYTVLVGGTGVLTSNFSVSDNITLD